MTAARDPRAERLFERLGHFSRRAARAHRRADVHHALVRDAREGIDARYALLYLAPPAGEGLRLVSASGALDAADASPRLGGDDGPIVHAYRRCVSIHEASEAHLPVLVNGLSIGVLSLGVGPDRELTPMERAFLDTLTRLGADALEAVRHRGEATHAGRTDREVLAMLAHELRHPLSVIVMKVATLRQKAGEPLRADVDAVDRSAARLSRLIQDAMDVSQIASGRFRIRVSPHRLEVAELLRHARQQSPAPERVALCLPHDGPDLTCDRGRVLQVLDNLIGNALKFTPEPGRVVVRVEVDDVEVVFHVEDEGRGVPSDELGRLFDPPRADRARPKRPGEGAGLGLYISRGLVEAHGGRLWARSEEGRGSRFSFALPRSLAHPSRDRPVILVAEADATSRRDVVEVLDRAGYHALGVATGRAAQAYLRSRPPPSLVLLDPALRDVSGAELMAWIRAELDGVPVVLVRSGARGAGEALDADANACLDRPLVVGELLAMAARFAQPSAARAAR